MTKEGKDKGILGDHVRRLREARGLSLRGLAAAAGVDATYVMRLERGEYASPDPHLLQHLARVLEVGAGDLFLAAGYPSGSELPGFTPYLRARYDLPSEAVAQLSAHFELLADKYGRDETEGVRP